MEKELKGKTAIVTGAAGGIGEGIAMVFGREGANVVVMDRSDQGASVAKKIVAKGGKAISVVADVTNAASLDALVAATIKTFGAVDILVNNAGIEAPPGLLMDLPEAQWDRVLGVNLKGVFLCCKAVIPAMIAKGRGGRIINIGSIASLRMTFFGSADYTASKHGMAGLTKHLAWELADHRITVNAVCPGGVVTPLMEKNTSAEMRESVTARLIPLGRMCNIEELGEAASFFASDRADMITGQLLAVDGGLLTGYGEDLRKVVRKRMADMKGKKH